MTPDGIAGIDEQLKLWRQGDFVLTDALPALHLAHMGAPGTPESAELAATLAEEGVAPDLAAVMLHTAGFMVVSQTCDIVRARAAKPYVEVCPLQPVPADKMSLVRSGRMPRYVWSPGLGDANLAADLELVTTIGKATLVRFGADRRTGVATDREARALAEALGRKRSRAAFPNDFTALVGPLQRRIIERHGRESAEGRFLRAIREIRVIATPNWKADEIEVELLFLFEGAATIPSIPLPRPSQPRASHVSGILRPWRSRCRGMRRRAGGS